MSETKWTPGPWVIDPATRPMEVCTIHQLPYDERTDGQGWAYIRGALGHWDVDGDEAMANAHLIAAAPDLYELLDMVFQSIRGGGRVVTFSDDDYDEMRDALAKARGET